MRKDVELSEIFESEIALQRDCLRLIPSENYVSPELMRALGSVFTNRYSEGYPGARYYQGQSHTDALERLAIERAKAIFGAEHVNVQPLSGSPANMAAYLAFAGYGDRILGLGLSSGGHLTHGWKVNFSGQLYESERFEVDRDSELIDYDALRDHCLRFRPKVMMIGTTSYSRRLDFETLSGIAKECGAIFVADIAHVAGLIAAGVYPNPVPYADAVTLTTHKTLRGPRGGMIMCKSEHAKAIDRAIFPGIQGGPHMNVIAALCVALRECEEPSFKDYARACVENARVLADRLCEKGLRVVSGGTDSHMFVLDLTALDLGGKTAAVALERAGMICNFNAIPYDPKPPKNPSGIRIGTPCVSTRGLRAEQMAYVSEKIYAILSQPEDEALAERTAGEIREFLKAYPVPGDVI